MSTARRREPHGWTILCPGGDRAYVPEPLPPPIAWDADLAAALSRADLAAGRLTIQELEALCPGVNRRTLQRDLKALVGKGLRAERGTGPTDPTRHYGPGAALLAAHQEL